VGSAEASPQSSATFSSMWTALRALARNSQFIVLVCVYGGVLGFNGAWSTTLNLNLSHAGLNEDAAGYIGFSGMMVGNVVGLVAGRLADRFHRMKPVLLVLLTANMAALVVFSGAAQPLVHLSPKVSLVTIWVAAVVSNASLYGAEKGAPVLYEVRFITFVFPSQDLFHSFLSSASRARSLQAQASSFSLP
jgi:nitrate/nitrite transporter NarK